MKDEPTIGKGILVIALPSSRLPVDTKERIQRVSGGREVLITQDKDELERILDNIEIGFGDVPFSLLPRMPRLKWVQLWSAGADKLQDHPELKNLPFLLTSTSGMHGRQLTEHIFAFLLAWSRRLPQAFAAQKEHRWYNPGFNALPVLAGKTMLILGYGAIGRETAQAAQVFGMQVIGVRRHIPAALPQGPSLKPAPADPIRVEEVSQLEKLLPLADVVVNLLPLTQDTRHFFGKPLFTAMKSSAVYINVGRGGTTDEGVLMETLKSKGIAGALLDVMETEPLPPDSPLWDLENLILTGHYAGLRPDYDDLALEIALDNLSRYVQGEPLKNLVDKKVGY
jgi:phosphoglycerate dehydrogenase-like enzyme